jgi:hypothetical protein
MQKKGFAEIDNINMRPQSGSEVYDAIRKPIEKLDRVSQQYRESSGAGEVGNVSETKTLIRHCIWFDIEFLDCGGSGHVMQTQKQSAVIVADGHFL